MAIITRWFMYHETLQARLKALQQPAQLNNRTTAQSSCLNMVKLNLETHLLNQCYWQLQWHGMTHLCMTSHQLRILIDSGLEVSFISKNTVDLLKLPQQHSSIPILGVGGTHSTYTLRKVQIDLRPIHKNIKVRISAHIIRQVSSILPSEKCEQLKWNHMENLNLADPTFWKPQPVDLLIGANYYGQITKPNLIKGNVSEPVAQLSIFGWLIIGPFNAAVPCKTVHHRTVAFNTEELQKLHAFGFKKNHLQLLQYNSTTKKHCVNSTFLKLIREILMDNIK